MSRRPQHREQRESNTKKLSELKHEVQQLKRQLARERREVERLQGVAEEPEASAPEKKVVVIKCPKCEGIETGSLTTPSGKCIVVCKSCKFRF